MRPTQRLRIAFAIASALALTQCAWILGFESSYSIEAPADGSTTDVVTPSSHDAGTFGPSDLLVTGEATPFGGIAVTNDAIYWTHAGSDGGVRSIDKDGGTPKTIASALKQGLVGEIYAVPGDTIHWLEEEGPCAMKTRCGLGGEGGWGTCGARALRLRTDGRRLYVLLDESLATAKWPIAVVSKGCPNLTQITRLYGDASYVSYANITPDESGNRVFAVAGNNVDCLPVGGGPTVHVVSGNVLDFVADDAHLYWLAPSEVHRCRFPSDTACGACTDDEVIARTHAGSTPELRLDGDTLYWLVDDGIASVPAAAPAGSIAVSVVSGQPSPAVFTLDATGLYWANADGSIARAPRQAQ